MSTDAIHTTLNDLQDRIITLRDAGEHVSPAEWQKLRADVERLCTFITHTDGATAHGLLPTLGDMIMALDQVIEALTPTE